MNSSVLADITFFVLTFIGPIGCFVKYVLLGDKTANLKNRTNKHI